MPNFKKLLIGRPLKNTAIKEEKYTVLWGFPILASDAVSSIAYASEEILLVLVPIIGYLAYSQLTVISSAIIALLVLLVLSYSQTIEKYPSGGGAYIVAKDNLGVKAGVAAGAALSVDYVLTVAVSVSSGVAAIISAFPNIAQYRVYICVAFLFILAIGNLRGIKESARIFSLPTYAFILGILSMIVYGFIKVKVFGYTPPLPSPELLQIHHSVSLGLLLMAFSSGCAAVTGVEAVSNAVPNFKEPATKRAKRTLMMLGFTVFICFGGVSLLANMFEVVPNAHKTVLSQIAVEIFGPSFMFYFIQVTTALILVLAANTAYTGFPLLLSIMAKDGYAPRQLTARGDRLSFSNGIILLTLLAGLLIIVFKGDTHLLIPLYAVGVFMSFTLSQTGMFIRWITREKGKGRIAKAAVNGLGALVTGVAVIVIGTTKFIHGAWIVIVVIPILITLALKIKRHYIAIACQLGIEDKDLPNIDISGNSYRNHVIVPIASINKASIRALRYARTISDNVVAFNIAINEEDAKRIRRRWELLNTDIKLVVKYSPFRRVTEPLIKFVESEEHEYQKGDMITVIMPQFSIKKWWQIFLHNQSRLMIANNLLKHKHIVVCTMPLQLKEDRVVLKKNNINKI